MKWINYALISQAIAIWNGLELNVFGQGLLLFITKYMKTNKKWYYFHTKEGCSKDSSWIQSVTKQHLLGLWQPFSMMFMQVYTPTIDAKEEEIG